MDQKNKIQKKQAAIKSVTKEFDICSNCDTVTGDHIHLKGAVAIVKDNESHKITMTIPESLIL